MKSSNKKQNFLQHSNSSNNLLLFKTKLTQKDFLTPTTSPPANVRNSVRRKSFSTEKCEENRSKIAVSGIRKFIPFQFGFMASSGAKQDLTDGRKKSKKSPKILQRSNKSTPSSLGYQNNMENSKQRPMSVLVSTKNSSNYYNSHLGKSEDYSPCDCGLTMTVPSYDEANGGSRALFRKQKSNIEQSKSFNGAKNHVRLRNNRSLNWNESPVISKENRRKSLPFSDTTSKSINRAFKNFFSSNKTSSNIEDIQNNNKNSFSSLSDFGKSRKLGLQKKSIKNNSNVSNYFNNSTGSSDLVGRNLRQIKHK